MKLLILPVRFLKGRIFLQWRGSAQGSLVQRELSAKLTEGLFYRSINILANATEILADFIIGNANNGKTITFQKSRSFCILF